MATLEGKRIVITGSSRSLGRHFALACAEQGASLVINGTREAARAMRDQGGGPIIQITFASGLVGNFGQTNYAARYLQHKRK